MIIDGHSLAFRAFHALPLDSFQTHDGQHTNAIHGFLSMLLSLFRNEKPTHIAVAFDISRFSFRTREYPEYKGTRSATPSEFIGQITLLEEALKAMNITTLTKEDYEADDILATLSVRGVRQGYHVLLVSGDRDTIQLVNDDVTLLYPASQGVSALTRYDPARVREKYGIDPAQYPDVAALVGETSDNLIGISKVGEKTAVKWLGLYGSLDGILEHADEIKGVVGNNLREQKENAIRNRRLNRLVTDLELPVELPDLARAPINEQAVRDVFGRLEFKNLLERVIKLEGGVAPAAVRPELPVAPVARDLLDEELAAWIERASAASPTGLGLTVEVFDGKPIGFGLASATETLNLPWQPGRADYAPFEAWLASDDPKIMHDAKHQLKAMRRANLPFSGLAVDTLIAGWLLRPGGPDKTISDLVSRYLDETLPAHDPNQLVPDELQAGGLPLQPAGLRLVGDELVGVVRRERLVEVAGDQVGDGLVGAARAQQPAGDERVDREAGKRQVGPPHGLQLVFGVVHDLRIVAGQPRLERRVIGASGLPGQVERLRGGGEAEPDRLAVEHLDGQAESGRRRGRRAFDPRGQFLVEQVPGHRGDREFRAHGGRRDGGCRRAPGTPGRPGGQGPA